jgi:Ser/Thr protein kinase RdoA (MazF antagonist)
VKRAIESVDKHPITAEIPLTGGRTTVGVVRIGETVRRPQSAQSPFVHRLLKNLEASGFTGAPRFVGVDDREREILSFLPGDVPSNLGVFNDNQLDAAARLLRTLHDATQDSDLRGSSEVVCHGDASPCNAVFKDGLPYAWIDFDAASPGKRSEDFGYAAWLWLDIGDDEWTPEVQSRRLARFFAEYGAAPTIVPVQAVLDAQARLCNRDGGHKAWAERCRAWTERNLSAFRAP